MRVIVMIKANRQSEAGELPSQRLFEEMGKYNDELVKAGIMLAAEGLHPSSRAKRVRFAGNKLTVTDGPFIELKELLGGFAVLEVNSLDEAIEWSKRFLQIIGSGESEIVQLLGPDDFGPA